jgi:hypothetical protein
MADLWMPGAQRADVGDHAPCDTQYPAKAIAHITWDRNATAAKPQDLVPFANLKSYFTGGGRGMAPHILWDPFHGTFAQFYPATSRAKSVVDLAGGTRTNRAGKVVIQIEALFFPYCRVDGKVYAKLSDTPCKGWEALQNWVHSWGVSNAWPMGRPTSFTPHRSESVWEKQGGWYGHSQVPENTHQDPGSWPAFVSGGTTTAPAKPVAKPQYEPFPGAAWFVMGRKSPIVAALHDRLVAVGCNHYQSSANKDVLGSGDKTSYEAWQRKCGYPGDWPPGKTTWDLLKVPNV